MHLYGTQIAFMDNKNPLISLIYLPEVKELYYAEAGKGSFLNNKPIHVSGNKDIENSVVTIEAAVNIIVIKTIPGAAQICASAIDYMGLDDIAGTLAGDDTVFVAIKSVESVEYILQEFKKNIR
jgi:arginine repressor